MITHTAPARLPAPGRYVGPPPRVGALVLELATAGAAVAARGTGVLDGPDGTVAEGRATALGWFALLQLLGAIGVAVLTATLTTVLEVRGMRVAGVAIARAGGGSAAALLAVSGIAAWALGQVDDGPVAEALRLVAAAAAGPAYAALLGLLVLGLSLPVLLGRLAPAWTGATGLALVVVAELSLLAFVAHEVWILAAVARWAVPVWFVAAAVTVPQSRRGVPRWDEAPAP